MLILMRHIDEATVIHTPLGDVTVVVLNVERDRATLGFDAPKEWSIERPEMKHRKETAPRPA